MSGNYPIWWNNDITIYNRYENPLTQEITWYSTQLSNCFWNYIDEYRLDYNMALPTSKAICRIPKNSNFKNIGDWRELEDKTKAFTLSPGDIIVCGKVSDIINEYVKGSRSNDLIDKYKETLGCMRIQAVSIHIGGGRNNEHYFVRMSKNDNKIGVTE